MEEENAALSLPEESPVHTVEYFGVKAVSDLFLYRTGNYSCDHLILISFYGSESQTRGIFSALAQGYKISIDGKDVDRGGGYGSPLKYKSVKMGYGKSHACVWDEKTMKDCIIVFDGEDETSAWERLLKTKRIPYIPEWIPHIVRELKKEEKILELSGYGTRGYLWQTDDDSVCDIITQRIFQ
jgi:hypothetical protein